MKLLRIIGLASLACSGFFSPLRAQSALERDMLERVEKIEVFDSFEVPRLDVLNAIRISPESGRLFLSHDEPAYESGDRRLLLNTVADVDTVYNTCIQVFSRLLSGDDMLEATLDFLPCASYPFMMPDGCTLYFSAETGDDPDNLQGLGGRDLFRSNRDPETGLFMAPVNMGYPYNSEANDYLLAIDEYTGVGWLVSDRGHDPDDDMVTVFMFVPSEVRENYEPDDPDLPALASLSDIALTQRSQPDRYAALRGELDLLSIPVETAPQYSVPMPDGSIVTDRDLPALAADMAAYEHQRREYEDALGYLSLLRRRYAGRPDAETRDTILAYESSIENIRTRLRVSLRHLQEAIAAAGR